MKSQQEKIVQAPRRVAFSSLGAILCLISSFGAFTYVPAPPSTDFTMGVAPTTLTMSIGTSASYNVTITNLGGFSSATLSVTGLPSGVTFSPTTVTAGVTPLTLTSSISAVLAPPPGVPLTVKATDPSGMQTAMVTLIVVINPVPF